MIHDVVDDEPPITALPDRRGSPGVVRLDPGAL
jgi:hypothetical protein